MGRNLGNTERLHMIEISFDPMNLWLLATAVIFTFFGRWMFWRENMSRIIEETIDNLIKDEFIKTKVNDDGDIELLKYWEEH